ncbi:hypothetical protein RMATCC62417_06554 [Rhizopus microsporus]|nr:hypothetical protein RMATCC62417_06554 [Rhizopus microsporus]CEI91051.1 hypothetical protein RMCBS344292_05354 [Rhizopus microsporus]
MAKSLRSQAKKRTRAIKREKIFKPVEEARLQRLAEAQAEAANKPKVGDQMEEERVDEENQPAEQMMEVEEEPKKKISTSGPRSKRHARKLADKKKKKKKNPSLKF